MDIDQRLELAQALNPMVAELARPDLNYEEMRLLAERFRALQPLVELIDERLLEEADRLEAEERARLAEQEEQQEQRRSLLDRIFDFGKDRPDA